MSESNSLDNMSNVHEMSTESFPESIADVADPECMLSTKIETIEQAQELVSSIMSQLERIEERDERIVAIRDILDFFIAEHDRMISHKAEYSQATSQIFAEALGKIRQMMSVEGLKSAEEIIADKILEAQEHILKDKLLSAIPLLYTALRNSAHKEYWNDPKNAKQKNEIESLLTSIKEKWVEGGKKIDHKE